MLRKKITMKKYAYTILMVIVFRTSVLAATTLDYLQPTLWL
jgi:hypothetical protein